MNLLGGVKFNTPSGHKCNKNPSWSEGLKLLVVVKWSKNVYLKQHSYICLGDLKTYQFTVQMRLYRISICMYCTLEYAKNHACWKSVNIPGYPPGYPKAILHATPRLPADQSCKPLASFSKI